MTVPHGSVPPTTSTTPGLIPPIVPPPPPTPQYVYVPVTDPAAHTFPTPPVVHHEPTHTVTKEKTVERTGRGSSALQVIGIISLVILGVIMLFLCVGWLLGSNLPRFDSPISINWDRNEPADERYVDTNDGMTERVPVTGNGKDRHLTMNDMHVVCEQQYGAGHRAQVVRGSDSVAAYTLRCNGNRDKDLGLQEACTENGWGTTAYNTSLLAPASQEPWLDWYCKR